MNTKLQPLATGVSLAITVVVMYSICAAIWVVWQVEAVTFLNNLFHGLDFRKLQATENSDSVSSFVVPLIVLGFWGFFTGTLYAVVYNLLFRSRAHS